MARSVAFCFAVLLATFEIGSCLRCYQCNSQTDKTCGDPFTSTRYLTDCISPESYSYNTNYLSAFLPLDFQRSTVGSPRYCHKLVLMTGTVVRTCLDGNPNNLNQTCQILDSASRNEHDMRKLLKSCSACDRDACNGASSTTASIPLALLAAIASYVYYKQ